MRFCLLITVVMVSVASGHAQALVRVFTIVVNVSLIEAK